MKAFLREVHLFVCLFFSFQLILVYIHKPITLFIIVYLFTWLLFVNISSWLNHFRNLKWLTPLILLFVIIFNYFFVVVISNHASDYEVFTVLCDITGFPTSFCHTEDTPVNYTLSQKIFAKAGSTLLTFAFINGLFESYNRMGTMYQPFVGLSINRYWITGYFESLANKKQFVFLGMALWLTSYVDDPLHMLDMAVKARDVLFDQVQDELRLYAEKQSNLAKEVVSLKEELRQRDIKEAETQVILDEVLQRLAIIKKKEFIMTSEWKQYKYDLQNSFIGRAIAVHGYNPFSWPSSSE